MEAYFKDLYKIEKILEKENQEILNVKQKIDSEVEKYEELKQTFEELAQKHQELRIAKRREILTDAGLDCEDEDGDVCVPEFDVLVEQFDSLKISLKESTNEFVKKDSQFRVKLKNEHAKNIQKFKDIREKNLELKRLIEAKREHFKSPAMGLMFNSTEEDVGNEFYFQVGFLKNGEFQFGIQVPYTDEDDGLELWRRSEHKLGIDKF